MKYELGRPGYNKITCKDEDMELVFKHNGLYYRKAGIMKFCRTTTGKSWHTITRWMDNQYYWGRLQEIGVEPYLGRRIFNEHMILTNGEVLHYKTLRIHSHRTNNGKVRLMEDGEYYEFYPVSSVYYKFMLQEGEAFDPFSDVPYVLNRSEWNADIENLERRQVVKDPKRGPEYVEDKVND